MPRIAKPHTEESQRMRLELQEYLVRRNISANRLSSLVNVGQPTVSRFLSGRTKTVTPAISRVLSYAGIDQPKTINCITESIENARLRAALERNWDGTVEGAHQLAVMIDTIGSMLREMRLGSATGRSK